MTLTQTAYVDMTNAGDYILENFKYVQYVTELIDTIEDGVTTMSLFPYRLTKTGFVYRDLDIYLKPYKKLLFFSA